MLMRRSTLRYSGADPVAGAKHLGSNPSSAIQQPILSSYLTALCLSFPICKVGITVYLLLGGEDFNWLRHVKILEVSGTKCHIHVTEKVTARHKTLLHFSGTPEGPGD